MRKVELLDPSTFDDVTIIPSKDFARVVVASDLIANAKREMEEQRALSVKEIERDRIKGFEAAYKEGSNELIRTIAALQEEINSINARVRDRFESALSSLLIQYASDEMLEKAVHQAARDCSGNGEFIVLSHPNHIPLLENSLGLCAASNYPNLILRFEADPTLAKGEGFVFCNKDVFNISVDVVIASFVKAFRPDASFESGK